LRGTGTKKEDPATRAGSAILSRANNDLDLPWPMGEIYYSLLS